MSVGGGQGCLAVNVRSTPNSDRKFKGLASVATGHERPLALQKKDWRTFAKCQTCSPDRDTLSFQWPGG
jgi:hypothetical protein